PSSTARRSGWCGHSRCARSARSTRCSRCSRDRGSPWRGWCWRWRSRLAAWPHTKHNINAPFAGTGGVVLLCLVPEKIDRLANRGIAKFNSRDDDVIQLIAYLRRATQISLRADGLRRLDRLSVSADRLFPAFLHFPKLARPRLVIRLFAILVLGVVDFFLAFARRCVVRIEREHLVISFHCQVVPAGLVKAVSFRQQLFHLLDLFDERRAHRFVEITGLPQVRIQFLRSTTLGIVAVT